MPASQLLANLLQALQDPDALIQRAGVEVLSSAQDNVQAMGLVQTGRLYGSLAEGHPDNVSQITTDTGAFGTRVPYAALVADKPGQDFMALSNDTAESAVDAVADALMESL